MYGVLAPEIGLRSYQEVPYAYADVRKCKLYRISKEEFERLSIADGVNIIPDDILSTSLVLDNLLIPCEKGQASIRPWQKPMHFENLYMPAESIQITGYCNMNCPHCFNAKDYNPLQPNLSMEQIENLLDQSKACGIMGVTLTGGEPLLHNDILRIISAIHDRGMHIVSIVTNGYYITEEFLKYLTDLGEKPGLRISFDGIGYHDTFRHTKGAEERALHAISLAKKAGLSVLINMNVNRANKPLIKESIDLMDSCGVDEIRVIRTSESPRWTMSGGVSLTVEEYYDFGLELLKSYKNQMHHASLYVWQFAGMDPIKHTYYKKTVRPCSDRSPLCSIIRNCISISANGNIYPCMQSSGTMDAAGITMGNIFEMPLSEILQRDSDYMKFVRCSVRQRAEINGICAKCKYYHGCYGGCPVIGFAESILVDHKQSLYTPDYWKCLFFKNGYSEKLDEILAGYTNLTPMPKN